MSDLRRVLITGGTGKVGRALAEGFANVGWQVVITSRSQERADSLAMQIQKKTDSIVHGVAAELCKADKISLFIGVLKTKDLLPHCLINNARNLDNLKLNKNGHPFNDSWHREFQLSVVTAYELSMQLAEMQGADLENIINISSMYGVVAATPHLYDDPVNQSSIHYGVCKAALIHLTKELAVRLAPRGIRVNAVSYGGIQGRVNEDFLIRYSKLTPQGRMLNDEDVAAPALFLSGEASAVTGHNLIVDGGWSIW